MEFGLRVLMGLPARAKETVCRFPLVTLFLCIGAFNHLYMNIFKPEKDESVTIARAAVALTYPARFETTGVNYCDLENSS